MINDLKISVVIPTFNEEKSIKKLIQSLITQTFIVDEIIISDARSNDKTLEIIKEFIKSNINIKYAQRNGFCRGAGRNAGIISASN